MHVEHFVDEQPSEARQSKTASRRIDERPTASRCSWGGDATRRRVYRCPLQDSHTILHLHLYPTPASRPLPPRLGRHDAVCVDGGRIWLNVRGTATINGRVTANGQSAGEGWTWRTACGGSVYLSAGALAGSGSITSNGGIADSSSSGYGQSGGGRVAVYLTGSSDFASFTGAGGVISAYGTRQSASGSLPTASCGTVYLQGANGEKRIILDNDNGCSDANCKVDLPVSVDRGGDDPKLFRDVTLVIRHRGGVNLMDDLLVKEVEVETANTSKSTFFLNDHTLTIRKWTHKNGKGWAKCSRSAGTEGLGKIVWQPKPLGIIVR